MKEILLKADLEYRVGGSDKVYHIWVVKMGGAACYVKFEYGRRGSTLNSGTKVGPTDAATATKVYTKIVDEKIAKGYKAMASATKGGPSTGVATAPRPIMTGTGKTLGSVTTVKKKAEVNKLEPFVPQLLNNIDENGLKKFIDDDNFVLQQKHDGKRMMLGRGNDGTIGAFNKKGQPIAPPEEFAKVLHECFNDYSLVIDGEACGGTFWAFDLVLLEDAEYRHTPYDNRLALLGMLLRSAGKQEVIQMVKTAYSVGAKLKMIESVGKMKGEGIVIKDLTAPYTAGRPNSGGPQMKFKFVKSASCVVAKINDKRSVGLELVNDQAARMGRVNVGNVSIPVNHKVPEVGDVVEVQYLYAYKGGSLYQPVYLGKRDDVDINECVMSQLHYKADEGEEEAGPIKHVMVPNFGPAKGILR